MKVKNLQEWHEVVCSREGYKCRVCKKDFSADHYFQEDNNGCVNQYLCGHHYPHTQKARPDLVLETDNGVPVCLDCHTLVHRGLKTIPELSEEQPEPTANKYVLFGSHAVRLHSRGVLCKCKKFIAMPISGICMACEKRPPANFKEKKKPKK